jgi:hypothetical protein
VRAIQPILIINPSAPQKIRKFRDRHVTQICDSLRTASPPSPRRRRRRHASEVRRDTPIPIPIGPGAPKGRRSALRRSLRECLDQRLAIVTRMARRTQPALRGRGHPLFFSAASLRVKKSLPDRGGCSMINNLPKLMGESATRGRFQDENFKLLSLAHSDMEYRNILPLSRITAVIHLWNGVRSQVVHRPLAKSSNTRKLLEFKNEFIHQKQSRAVYRGECFIPYIRPLHERRTVKAV